jgi:hypothetical protein
MWYRKNVGGWERAARLIGGGLMLTCGVVALHASPWRAYQTISCSRHSRVTGTR